MFILFLATLAYADETPDFTLAQLPCAQAQTPVLTVDTAKVPWPFKAKAAKLVLTAKAQDYAHAEECTRLLTAAASTAAQDEAAGMIGTVAVAGGKDVSFDGRKAIVVTGNAATAHELPDAAFYGTRLGGYGQQGSVVDYTTVGNLAFLAGQQTPVAVVSGTGTAKAKSSAKAAPKVDPAEAEKARAAAAAKAEAERKARAAAAKAAAAKAEAGS